MDKALVLQDTKLFNETPIKPQRCMQALTRLLYLFYARGERLGSTEATNAFFCITKAFQSRDPNLRRMLYLLIKELATTAQDVIMVISSLTQDMNALPSFRANAVRVLGSVVDGSMISGVERTIRQAIGDGSPAVASAALCTAIRFFFTSLMTNEPASREAVRRWLPDATAVLQASSAKSSGTLPPTAQFHSLALLCLIKQNDRMALAKLVQQVSSTAGFNIHPLTACLVVRICGDLMAAGAPVNIDIRPMLRLKDIAVAVEASRLVCRFAQVSIPQQQQQHMNSTGVGFGEEMVAAAMSALQAMLGSNRVMVRYAAMRVLSEAVENESLRPMVARLNVQMEGLVADANRTVATMAITTLLKTGEESSVDRLVAQISAYVGDISDDFRIVIVDAVRSLGLKFPSKHRSMLDFLGTTLIREDGGLAYKEATVDAMCDLLVRVPEGRDVALSHLCEFIEDCEYPQLTARILHLLGEEGARAAEPSQLVRYIYNRLILEDSDVRAAAVGALAKIAAASDSTGTSSLASPKSAAIHGPKATSLRRGIISILRRTASEDLDDNVRDRAVLSLSLLEQGDQCCSVFLDPQVVDVLALEQQLSAHLASVSHLMTETDDYSLASFDISHYQDAGQFSTQSVPRISKVSVFERARADAIAALKEGFGGSRIQTSMQMASNLTSAVDSPSTHDRMNLAADFSATSNFSAAIRQPVLDVPEFAAFGSLLASSLQSSLTEADTEFVVMGRSHIFSSGHLVLEFECRNTVPELSLESVCVNVRHAADSPVRQDFSIAIEKLHFDEPAYCYVVYEFTNGGRESSSISHPEIAFACALKFTATEVDPNTGQPTKNSMPVQDEYNLDTMEITLASYIAPREPIHGDFDVDAESLPCELTETFELPGMKSISSAIEALTTAFGGLRAFAGSDQIPHSGGEAGTHTLLLLGSLVSLPSATSAVSPILNANGASCCESSPFSVKTRLASIRQGMDVAVEISIRATTDQLCNELIEMVC